MILRHRFVDLFTTTATEASNFALEPQKWLADLKSKTLEVEHEGKRASAVDTNLAPLRAVCELLQASENPNNNSNPSSPTRRVLAAAGK